jgi:hypothetical protein
MAISSEETKRRMYQSDFSFGCDLLSLKLEQLSKERKECLKCQL